MFTGRPEATLQSEVDFIIPILQMEGLSLEEVKHASGISKVEGSC